MSKATANLNRDGLEVQMGNDGIVIVKALCDVPGGRTLDVSGLPSDMKVIKAGHIIIKDSENFKPMPINSGGDGYASLPSKHSYVGVLKASILVKEPQAAILTIGQVKAAACPYTVTDGIKSGLPRIEFL